MTTQAVPLAGLQTIPLSAITPNPLNPRKHFDKDALNELAESIKTHGVRQPILVRPKGKDKFEIVCGERRFRASKLAGKADVPAIVDPDLSDGQALEISILENLQRQDVHPLEEAMGYKALMDMSKDPAAAQTAEAIAAKVGKSIGYVYARLKLLALTPSGRKLFIEGEITAGHAVLIARLQPDDQEKALKSCFDNGYGGGKGPLIPEKSLRKWIQENVQLNLDKAPFDITDAKLVPSAGACTNCPKRSGTNPVLFDGMQLGKNTCMDPTCYQTKKMALVNINVDKVGERHGEKPILISHLYSPGKDKVKGILYESEYRAEYWKNGKRQMVKAGSCNDAKLAVYADGEQEWQEGSRNDSGKDAGKAIHVCTNRKCSVHSERYDSSTGTTGDDRKKQRIAKHFCMALYQAVAAKVKKPTRADRELIALELFKKLGHYSETPMITALGWDKKLGQWNAESSLKKKFAAMKDDELESMLLFMALAPELNSRTTSEPKDLLAVAGRHKVKTDELLKASREKFAKKPAKPSAKKPAPKSKK